MASTQPTTQKCRAGFTLVELLVVIAIIGILISMLLPAIQSIRESARRTDCMNNVRQLALASLNYESAHMEFPVGIVDDDDDLRDALHNGWVFMLPFLDQGNVFDMFDFDQSWKSSANVGLAALSIDFLNCPSNPVVFDQTGAINGTKSDYAMNHGPGVKLFESQAEGVFGINLATKIGSVTDGTSNTYLIGEAFSNDRIEGQGG